MTHVFLYVGFFVGGTIFGVLGHVMLAQKATVTKEELTGWAQRLRNAVVADATTAKNSVTTLIGDIEKKL
jgi:hypothetical protein